MTKKLPYEFTERDAVEALIEAHEYIGSGSVAASDIHALYGDGITAVIHVATEKLGGSGLSSSLSLRGMRSGSSGRMLALERALARSARIYQWMGEYALMVVHVTAWIWGFVWPRVDVCDFRYISINMLHALKGRAILADRYDIGADR